MEHNLLEVKFGIYAVGSGLAHIAGPTRSTAGRTGNRIGYGILARQHAYPVHTVVCDYIAGEYGVILLEALGHYFDKSLDIVNKSGIEVVHYTADAVVVECHAGSASTFKYVEHAFTLTHCIEEHCSGSEVHTECADEQQVR